MNNSGDYLLCTVDECDRFSASMASCIAHFSTEITFLKLPPLESPKPEPKLPLRFPLYNYRPVTMDEGMTNTVSGMLLRFVLRCSNINLNYSIIYYSIRYGE